MGSMFNNKQSKVAAVREVGQSTDLSTEKFHRFQKGTPANPAANPQPEQQAAPAMASPIEEQRRRRNAGGANVLG